MDEPKYKYTVIIPAIYADDDRQHAEEIMERFPELEHVEIGVRGRALRVFGYEVGTDDSRVAALFTAQAQGGWTEMDKALTLMGR